MGRHAAGETTVWRLSSAAVYAPVPMNMPWPKFSRPVCPDMKSQLIANTAQRLHRTRTERAYPLPIQSGAEARSARSRTTSAMRATAYIAARAPRNPDGRKTRVRRMATSETSSV